MSTCHPPDTTHELQITWATWRQQQHNVKHFTAQKTHPNAQESTQACTAISHGILIQFHSLWSLAEVPRCFYPWIKELCANRPALEALKAGMWHMEQGNVPTRSQSQLCTGNWRIFSRGTQFTPACFSPPWHPTALWLFLHRVFGATLQAPSLCHLFHPPW